jgi:hypothetical protein
MLLLGLKMLPQEHPSARRFPVSLLSRRRQSAFCSGKRADLLLEPHVCFSAGAGRVGEGIFREEGFEPLLVQMRSQVAVPAMMNGDIQYTLTFGNIMTAALQGMPFKQLAILTEKPLHHVVARPEIKTIAELKGNAWGRSESADRTISRRRRSSRQGAST